MLSQAMYRQCLRETMHAIHLMNAPWHLNIPFLPITSATYSSCKPVMSMVYYKKVSDIEAVASGNCAWFSGH